MLYYLCNLVIILFEVICCKIFFGIFNKSTEKPRKTTGTILVVILVCLDYAYVMLFSQNFLIKEVVVILTIAIIMKIYQRTGFIRAIVIAVLYQGLILLVDYIVYVVNHAFVIGNDVTEPEYLPVEGLMIAFGKIVLFLCVLLVRRKFSDKSTEILTNTEWVRFLSFPLFTIITIAALLLTFKQIDNQSQIIVLCIIEFGMIGMNLVVYYLINDIIEREKRLRESKSFELQVHNQIEMYRSISENYEQQKVKSHEFQNMIMCIESLAREKNYAELEKYVNVVGSNFNSERNAVNTNNVIINAVLNTKYSEALSKNIVVIYKVNDLSDLEISDEDLVILLSNLLNNAIEACEQCENRRVLKLKFIREECQIVLAVKNTSRHPVICENNEIKTTKLVKPEEHGIGIKNIIRVAEKYDASYIIKSEKNEFYFSILFNI